MPVRYVLTQEGFCSLPRMSYEQQVDVVRYVLTQEGFCSLPRMRCEQQVGVESAIGGVRVVLSLLLLVVCDEVLDRLARL